jgi:hypothetical protein
LKKIIIVLILAINLSSAVSAEDLNALNPFGVLEFLHWNHSWNNYKYSKKEELQKAVKLMQEAGVGWVRMDFVWDDIEPEQGKFNFDKYDYIVELLDQNNINILGILDYSASWASSCGQWNCSPRDNKLFVNYVTGVIARYKNKVKYWEIWNEPDSHTYWVEQDGLKSYCVLLKDVYLAAKAVDPECKILNGGLANMASIHHLYDNGTGDYFDILNIHVFESPINPSSAKRLIAYPRLAYKIMRRNGDGHKKIWVTEIGCPGVIKGAKTNNWWMGKNPTERQQRAWVKEVFKELLKHEAIDKVFWAFFRDCKGHWNSGVDYFGLIRWDFSRKPSFFAYQQMYNKWDKEDR